jgi:hypothetical protein
MDFSVLLALIKEKTGWKAVVDVGLIAAGLFFLYHTLLRLGTWRIVTGKSNFGRRQAERSAAPSGRLEVRS